MPRITGYTKTYNWTRTLRAQIINRDGGCRLCGHPGTDGRGKTLTKAHIVPHSQGGTDTLDNLILLCRPCHGRYDAQRRAEGTHP